MNSEQALKILRRFDSRIIKQTKNCTGSAVVLKEGRLKFCIFLKERKTIHDHLLNLRFSTNRARLVKDDSETYQEEELSPVLSVAEFKFTGVSTEKQRPAFGGISVGHVDMWTTAGTLAVTVFKDPNSCDYTASGEELSPDCSGGFKIFGSWNGKPYYKLTNESGDWFLWWQNGIMPIYGFTVSGDINPPSAKGEYKIEAVLNTGPYYKHVSEEWYIFCWYANNRWYISDIIGPGFSESRPNWKGDADPWPFIEGDYAPNGGGVSGAANVARSETSLPGWNCWVISNILGDTSEHCWRGGRWIQGDYLPEVDVSGIVTVKEYKGGKYEPYGYSCNHVLSAESSFQHVRAQVGDIISQPGMFDLYGSPPYSTPQQDEAKEKYRIGKLADWLPLVEITNPDPPWPYNHVDGAIFKPIDYTVIGNPAPDCSGDYEAAVGTYNGKKIYYHTTSKYVIWWQPERKRWVITDERGVEDVCWENSGSDIKGTYNPVHGATGKVTVKIGLLDSIMNLLPRPSAKTWVSGYDYTRDDYVYGNPDYTQVWHCKKPHTSQASNRPTSGASYALYWEQSEITYVKGLTMPSKMPEIGEEVMKVGRTTGRSTGIIIGITGLIVVSGSGAYGQYYYYTKQILTEAIGAAGDSGSLLLNKCGKGAVGILYAGSEELQVYNPAICVEKELDVRFAKPKRIPVLSYVRRILGKIYSTGRKICNRCKCAAKATLLRCIPPFTWPLPPDCSWFSGNAARTARTPCPKELGLGCEDYYCGPNPPNATSVCPLYLVTDCWLSEGVCLWVYESMGLNDPNDPCMMYMPEDEYGCRCDYLYVEDSCGMEGDICDDTLPEDF